MAPPVERGKEMTKDEDKSSRGIQYTLKGACMSKGGGKKEMVMRRILSLVRRRSLWSWWRRMQWW